MYLSANARSRLPWLPALLAGLITALASVSASADDIKLRIASGAAVIA